MKAYILFYYLPDSRKTWAFLGLPVNKAQRGVWAKTHPYTARFLATAQNSFV